MAAEPLIGSDPAEALSRARQLLGEGKGAEARLWLQAACADAQALPAEQAAGAWCLLGLQQREQGEEGRAGRRAGRRAGKRAGRRAGGRTGRWTSE